MAETPVRPLISLVVPCFNEEHVLPLLRDSLAELGDRLATEHGCDSEFLLVDDGSRDRTWELIRDFAARDPRVRAVRLSRNFGHQAALTCGYDLASGQAIVSLDADLQDPPEVVPEMVARWRAGADVVYAIRDARPGETRFKLWTAKMFYRLIHRLSAADVREDSGDFRLMSRRSVDALGRLRERHRFIRGMVGWIGFRTDEVHYQRRARAAGATKYPLRKMLLFAIDGIVSFSRFPLKLAYWSALVLCSVFFGYLAWSLVRYLFMGASLVSGWTSLIVSVIAFGATNLLCLGLMGEYIGRIYEEVKQRPLYLVGDRAPGTGPPDGVLPTAPSRAINHEHHTRNS